MNEPKTSDVLRALRANISVRAHSIRRFQTGLAHYVYEVMTDGDPLVVRMANPGRKHGLPGAIYWYQRLKDLGVPLPALIGHDLNAPFPYMILERLPGRDLGAVYASLTRPQKKNLAAEIVDIQDRVAALPQAAHYGWLDEYENPSKPFPNWRAVLESGLVEAHEYIVQIGIFQPEWVVRVRAASAAYESYFDEVAPAPFLDDTTTKNVIVHGGKLSGIVDVDNVCFGDRLYVLALTHMSLLASGHDTIYIDAWVEGWDLNEFKLRVMNLYTAMHGVYFMSEIGRTFNKNRPEAGNKETVDRLNAALPMLLDRV